jgi:hypothetical protein
MGVFSVLPFIHLFFPYPIFSSVLAHPMTLNSGTRKKCHRKPIGEKPLRGMTRAEERGQNAYLVNIYNCLLSQKKAAQTAG